MIKPIKMRFENATSWSWPFVYSQAEKTEKESLFGPLNPVRHEEYGLIYSTTGIDVDGRREIAQHHMPSLEASIRNYICIVKYIPVTDRSYLIKREYNWWNEINVGTLRVRQNGRSFVEDIFKVIFVNGNCVLIQMSLQLFPMVQLTISQHWFWYWHRLKTELVVA